MMDRTTATGGTGGRRVLPTARDLVAWVVRELPKASRDQWLRRFDEMLEMNPHCQPVVNEHYFVAAERDLRATCTKAARDTARKDILVRALADKMMSNLLLLRMPNHKRMVDCTGAEMSAFGKGYERIAEAVGPDKRVGEVLSEDEVRRLMVGRRGK